MITRIPRITSTPPATGSNCRHVGEKVNTPCCLDPHPNRRSRIRDVLEGSLVGSYPQALPKQTRRTVTKPKRSLRWQDRALLIIAIVLMSLLTVRIETAAAEEFGLEFQVGTEHVRSVALDTDINVDITGLIARVSVRQTFRNPGSEWAEGVYRFPLPVGAAVDRMRIETDGRILEGEIQQRESARRVYQQARDSGRTASIVDQQSTDQFETRLANIRPGATVTVEIAFLTRVEHSDGRYGLKLPMTFTPSWNSAQASRAPAWPRVAPSPVLFGAAPLHTPEPDDRYLSMTINLHLDLPLSHIESLHHDVDIHPTLGGYHVFLSDPEERTDRQFELTWRPDLGSQPNSSLLTWDGGDAVYALLMLTPPLEQYVHVQPRELIFVIDTSGSMEGTSLTQARSALQQGLQLLGPDDTFNLVQFNSRTEALFDLPVPPDPGNLLAATDYIDSLVANGGTDMAPALQFALQGEADPAHLRQIIFITDGSVDNEGDLLLQIAEDLGESRLFTVAIGSAPNTWFMRKAAEIGRGSHTAIGRSQDVTNRMNRLWSRIQRPALQDVCVDWGMESETYPEIIPDLYAGEPLWLVARLPYQPTDVIVCGDLAGQHWENTTIPVKVDSDDSIASLWGRGKVDALEESRIFGVDEVELKSRITDVALEYGLLTSYTSLVAVDRTPSRAAGHQLNSQQIPGLLPAGSTNSTVGFSSTGTGWKTQLVLALITLALATALLFLATTRLPMANHPSLSGRSVGRRA